MRESVKELRANKCSNVNKCYGYYIWWFHPDCVKSLLAPLPGVDYNKLVSKEYVALYIGTTPKQTLYSRIKWHIFDKHTAAKVKNGTLSTLRQTLSALLGMDMTKSEAHVNAFIDKNCEVEWHPTSSAAEAEKKEHTELTTNYYPLNIKENKIASKATKSALKDLRKKHRK